MYFTDLICHKILEFRYGERPFGFWNWKRSINNTLKKIKDEFYPCYYWASYHGHPPYPGRKLDYNIYKIYTYRLKQKPKNRFVSSCKTYINNIQIYIFKDKNYFEEFKKSLDHTKPI
jgi:hypothetical protein